MSVTKEDARSCRSESSGQGVADDILEDVGAGGIEGVVADDDTNPLITEDHVSEDVTALMDLMEERRVGGKSILVEPADLLSKEAQASAECSLSLVDPLEYVELKSFIEAELERKLQSMPVNVALPHKVRVATEQRENYYFWMRQYLVKKSLHRRVFAHKMTGDLFVALIPPHSLAEPNMRHEALTCACAMTQASLPSFDTALWSAWKQKEEIFALLDDELDLDHEFMKFLVQQYYPTMQEVLSKHAASIFQYVPPVPVDHAASQVEVEERQKALKQVDAQVVEDVDRILAKKWDDFVGVCDATVQALCQTGKPSKKFVFKNYYSTLFQVLSDHSKGQTAHQCSASGHVRDSTSSLEVPTAVASTFCDPAVIFAGAAPSLQGTFNSAVSQVPSFWGMDALLTGQAMATEVAPQCQVEFMSAAEILQATPKTKCKFEGILLRCDSEPRQFQSTPLTSPRKRRADEEDSEKVALDLLLGDQTGPVMVTLWADMAKSFVDDVADQRARVTGTASLVVSFDIVEVTSLPKNQWNGRCLTSMRVLQTLPPAKERVGTKVSIGKPPMSPFLTSGRFAVPSGEVCISQFSQVKTRCIAPFRGTFKGVVVDLQDLDFSRSGNEVRRFKLVDAAGSFFQCAAMAQNAKSGALQENYEVVVYFGTGRGSIGTTAGTLYLMKDAAVVPIGRQVLGGKAAYEIHIQDAD